jgi:ribosomal protein L11 methyltransferase
MKWAELSIAVAGDLQEIVGALLTETAGCYGYASTATSVAGYLPVDDRLENTLLTLREALKAVNGVVAEITIRFVAEEDWANAWKQYFKPQRIGRRLVVKPTWEPYEATGDDLIIEVDPGMAFGTGLHATTRLCMRGLEDHVRPGMRVADVGTGSGILAVAAVLLGADSAAAVDNDPVAVRVARENVAVNRLEEKISVEESSVPPTGIYQIVVANILADVILGMADALFAATAPGGLLVASGIIDSRAEAVRDGLLRIGFINIVKTTDGEWVALTARRPV